MFAKNLSKKTNLTILQSSYSWMTSKDRQCQTCNDLRKSHNSIDCLEARENCKKRTQGILIHGIKEIMTNTETKKIYR